ncbi:MAG: DUF5131 family protein [Mycobacterium sp.]
MGITNIEWTDRSWNVLRGCSRVSEGCRHCYAEVMASRFSGPGQWAEGLATRSPSRWTGKVAFAEHKLDEPLRWRKPQRIFVNSMSDVFHEDVPDEWIDAIFGVMASAPQHTFQVLTKRPARMLAWFNGLSDRSDSNGKPATWFPFGVACRRHGVGTNETLRRAVASHPSHSNRDRDLYWPLPNVHLGVSVEDQATADARIPLLLQTPAAVRFISAEPLLGPVDIGLQSAVCDCCPSWSSRWIKLNRVIRPEFPFGSRGHVAVPGTYRAHGNRHGALSVETPCGKLGVKPAEMEQLPALDWVICGGESGPGARPCDVEWLRSIVRQCKDAGVPVFCKQIGARPYEVNQPEVMPNEARKMSRPGWFTGPGWSIQLKNRKGGDPSEWPEDLRVREMPKASREGQEGGSGE